MLEQLFRICVDNDFDEVELDGDVLTCGIRSFGSSYRLAAVEKNGTVELALADRIPFAATPEVSVFLERHGEAVYPFRRAVDSPSKFQYALDDLQSAADDFFGFAHDLAEERHTPGSADAALECNFALRDTPRECAMLDSLFAREIRCCRTLWQLSAGNDLRDLVAYGFSHFAELFVHTDCAPGFDLFAPGEVYEDAQTCVTLHLEREFDRMTAPQPARDENPDSGRVLLYRAEIVSERFGRAEKPFVQIVCGDAWFAAEFLAPNRLAAETVIDRRDGAGAWLMRALKILHAKRFVSAAPPDAGAGDDVLQKYPQLAGVPAALVPERRDPAGATVYGIN